MENFNFAKTCIGSMPHENTDEIVVHILKTFREIPFWPQMAKRSFYESMYVQYSEGFPGLVIDEKNKKVYAKKDDNFYPQLEQALENFLNGEVEAFKIDKKYALGLSDFINLAPKTVDKKSLKFLKGQVTGPVSYAMTMKDAEGQSIMYTKELEELIPKFLGMKAKWQIRQFKKIHDKVIIFLDEPYITSIGSSYVNMDKDKSKEMINESAGMIKDEGALCGIHCCGNTDWDFIMGLNIDILNFDAYSFMNEFLLYEKKIKEFLLKGKAIAWGIVPTASEELKKTDKEKLVAKLMLGIDRLIKSGVDKETLSRQSIITPSCGMGTLTKEESFKVFELLEGVSQGVEKF